jgi:hypothetical protein
VIRDYLAVSAATRAGAGAAAAAGRSISADCAAVAAVVSSLGSAGVESLDRIEVFRGNKSGAQVSTATNVYHYRFGDPVVCSSWESIVAWSPSVRHAVAGDGPLDQVGVRVVLDHGFASGVPPFAGVVTIDEAATTGLIPED